MNNMELELPRRKKTRRVRHMILISKTNGMWMPESGAYCAHEPSLAW